MPQKIFNNFKINLAEQFKNSISSDSIYLGFGKCSDWTSEPTPDSLSDTVAETQDVWNNLIGAKLLTTSNVSNVIPRIDWTTGSIYDQWSSSDADLFTKEFYVITTDYNVYKCISNNSGGTSTVMPTGTETEILETNDDYQWKFMYSVDSDNNFLTADWIPVRYVSSNPGSGSEYYYQWLSQVDSQFITNNHGENSLYELPSYYVMLYLLLEQDESSKFRTENDFRQISLIKNPKEISTGTPIATDSVYKQTTTLTVDSPAAGDYIEDDVVYQGVNLGSATASGTVVDFDSVTGEIFISELSGTWTTGENVKGGDGGNDRNCSDVEDVELYENIGKILYVENFEKIERNALQSEFIRIVFNFNN